MSEKDYWNHVYAKQEYERGALPTVGSTFAKSIVQKLPPSAVIVDLGCGNGRDSLFLAEQMGVKRVVGVDLAEVSVTCLKNSAHEEKVEFFVQDFSCMPVDRFKDLAMNVVYSRFTLHSVHKNAASATLKWSFEALPAGGLLFIEVRSIQDPLYGVGEAVPGEPDAWISSHFRRFVRIEQLATELVDIGFTLEYVLQSDNLSVYKDDNPVLIRIHARKK